MDFFGGSTGYDGGWVFNVGEAPPPPTSAQAGGWSNALGSIFNAASGAYQAYLRNDLANEAIARQSSVTFDNSGRVRSVGTGSLDLSALLPWLLVLVAVAFVWKLISGK